MTRYLLDTTSLVDYSKRHEPAFSRLDRMILAGEELGICAVNLAEFLSGLTASDWLRWEPFLNSLQYWDISREAAARAGRDRFDFARQGISLSTMDALIAAVAREHQAIIVTDNVKDYPQGDIQILPLSP